MRPAAHHAAGQLACSRLHDAHPALAQNFNVRLRGRMVPHVHIHRRRHKHRRSRSQIQRGKKIVGDAMGKFRQNVGRGRSDNERVGPLRLGDMVNAVLFGRGIARVPLLPQAGDDFVAGERGKGERLHKLLRRRCHHDVHLNRLPLHGAHQLRRLVCGDSARDAHGNSHDFDCRSGVRFQFTDLRLRWSRTLIRRPGRAI